MSRNAQDMGNTEDNTTGSGMRWVRGRLQGRGRQPKAWPSNASLWKVSPMLKIQKPSKVSKARMTRNCNDRAQGAVDYAEDPKCVEGVEGADDPGR